MNELETSDDALEKNQDLNDELMVLNAPGLPNQE